VVGIELVDLLKDLKPGRRPYVSRGNVADFLMRQLTDGAFLRKTPAFDYRRITSFAPLLRG
jgi:hypothetical protein